MKKKITKVWVIMKGNEILDVGNFSFGQLAVFKRTTAKGLVNCGAKGEHEKVVKAELKY